MSCCAVILFAAPALLLNSIACVLGSCVDRRPILKADGATASVHSPVVSTGNVPPVVAVTDPSFSLSVTQGDTLAISIQPTAALLNPSEGRPFDPDSSLDLFLVLDLNSDPNDDDPKNPDPSQVLLLHQQTIPAGFSDTITREVLIDLAVIPPRSGGQPYFVRATVDDASNPRVHSYATGAVSVVGFAAGIVDLLSIGKTKAGARFHGVRRGARTGSSVLGVGDFDADGVDDFVLAAQFLNAPASGDCTNDGQLSLRDVEAFVDCMTGPAVPASSSCNCADVTSDGFVDLADFGRIQTLLSLQNSAAYLVYGLNDRRFGGSIRVGQISSVIPGVIFQAPPVRTSQIPGDDAWTAGISDVSSVHDLSGDGRPEILFGLQHVHGAFEGMDFDPEDTDLGAASPGCYPDNLVNNTTDDVNTDPLDIQFYGGGMALIVNSENRDNNPRQGLSPTRLEATTVWLELVGQEAGRVLDGHGLTDNGNIFALADDYTEEGRIAGARFVAGYYDFVDHLRLNQPAREGLFGRSVASIGDLSDDGLDEIIISAPRNERYLQDLLDSIGSASTHWHSTSFRGSIVVVPGANYNGVPWRELGAGSDSNSVVPTLDQQRSPPFGRCTAPGVPRSVFVPPSTFEVFAEDIDDMLGDGQSAGDFNQDGLDDILCGAPFNDWTESLVDTGSTYIIYGPLILGQILLANADNPLLRPPMLRIRGLSRGDQIGWRQASGLDFNGDRIVDVFFSSPRADFGGVQRATCGGDDLSLSSFESCLSQFGEYVFSDDPCKEFDYDNDGDLDTDDRCVFCCLSGDCNPDDSCVFGRSTDCCADLVDNGFVGVIFGGVFIDGDRTIGQLATSQLPGVIFYGAAAQHRAGLDVSSAGDFNQDAVGDLLVVVPGETRVDTAGHERLGVVYLIFGGPHLINTVWSLMEVGSEHLPGIVFISPYPKGRPNEAAPTTAARIGDINDDGFGDIAIGNPLADFDPTLGPGSSALEFGSSTGRTVDTGDLHVIYGNNFGPNRLP
ncbi:MAG: hypothetical protein JSU86_19510 [Phycisphaerales bacterium]|nr:MAG: hypothetical protein JSU86_19510 [Phycisphaerales bacterium]